MDTIKRMDASKMQVGEDQISKGGRIDRGRTFWWDVVNWNGMGTGTWEKDK